ncbi:MAG: T9SS type A sorting domain-containing protein [Lewinella sp.]|uniref:T9SS type A sorting domain-containing protein n=1 Tax=Lewinella sp. TaxID=2004506 RepID=UPI003D6BB4FC
MDCFVLSKEVFLNIVNQGGQVLLNKSYEQLGTGNYREQLELSNLPVGLYLLQLVTPEGQATQPLLIIK